MISRLSLPLAFLETDKGNDGLGGNRLFSACIPVLEPQYSESVRSAVLITKSENDSRFYAIERVRNGIYALCTLGAWVDGKDLEKMKIRDSTVTKEKVDRHIPNLGNDWWRAAAIEANAAPNVNLSKKQKISGLEGLCLQLKPPSRETRSAAPVIQEAPSMTSNEQIFTTQSEPKDKVTSQQAPQNAEEILHMIRAQYQETLYMSQVRLSVPPRFDHVKADIFKTSLAYFAKGPLSRARAYFQGNDSPSANSIQLSEYLRGYILSLPTLDKKYRESLPAIVEGLPEDALSDNENGALIEALQKKSRRSKKYRIGKDGLYPEEEINIAKWWMSRKSSLNIRDLLQGGEDHSKKTRLTLQRVRETQMQIILVLETLALEILAPTQIISQDSQEHVSENQVDSEKKKKPRKAKDLRIFLDLLIDRLCIWQSMNTTEDSSTRNEEVTAPQELKKASNQPLEPNNLQTFCVDVVLPL